ncbi:unnamed protein product [Auanema sp. JU1783]|nr:unnamed protein product [Auanema sp. JU1783]
MLYFLFFYLFIPSISQICDENGLNNLMNNRYYCVPSRRRCYAFNFCDPKRPSVESYFSVLAACHKECQYGELETFSQAECPMFYSEQTVRGQNYSITIRGSNCSHSFCDYGECYSNEQEAVCCENYLNKLIS